MKRTTSPSRRTAAIAAAAVALSASGMPITCAEINAILAKQSYVPSHSSAAPEIITDINASMLVEDNFSEPLTTYAVGFRESADLDREIEFFAPPVEVSERFEYSAFDSADSFLSDPDEDLRARGADFPQIEIMQTKVDAHTENRGLQVMMERRKYDRPGMAEKTVARLLNRLKRNKLRRAIAALSAAANNTAKTWDTTAGKDPDQDVMGELIAAANISGIVPNRVGYGSTAWSKRGLAHRAQNTAGGHASASLTPEALAGILGVDEVLRSTSRYTSSASAKAEIVGNLVLMFMGDSTASEEDPSNIKDFWSPTEISGDRYGVYEWTIGSKFVGVAVEHYEKIAITSSLGIRKFTVS
jgi:hypothetical protein